VPLDCHERIQCVTSEILSRTEGRKILPIILQQVAAAAHHGTAVLDVTAQPEPNLTWLRGFVEQEAKTKARSDAITLAILGFLAVAALSSKG
jgi:hypothetical protein